MACQARFGTDVAVGRCCMKFVPMSHFCSDVAVTKSRSHIAVKDFKYSSISFKLKLSASASALSISIEKSEQDGNGQVDVQEVATSV